MKTQLTRTALILTCIASLALGLLASACRTTGTQTQQQRIETGVQAAAAIGGTIILVERPHWRGDVQKAVADLTALEAKESLTIADIMEIVRRVDPDALKSPKAIIYINTGILLLNEAGLQSHIPLEQAQSARGVARAVRAGLEQALIATAP